MFASHVLSKAKAFQVNTVDALSQSPWRPTDGRINIRQPLSTDANEPQHRKKRDHLAANAHMRYGKLKAMQAAHSLCTKESDNAPSLSFPHFRDRKKHLELAGEWVSANQVLAEHDRVESAVAETSAAYLTKPPYPKHGGSVKNTSFSHTSTGCANLASSTLQFLFIPPEACKMCRGDSPRFGSPKQVRL